MSEWYNKLRFFLSRFSYTLVLLSSTFLCMERYLASKSEGFGLKIGHPTTPFCTALYRRGQTEGCGLTIVRLTAALCALCGKVENFYHLFLENFCLFS